MDCHLFRFEERPLDWLLFLGVIASGLVGFFAQSFGVGIDHEQLIVYLSIAVA
ncbi:hypothetical protein ODV97_19675 [Enterococcus gallinarum]|nr:hypothetical protein [Enterococcus gallinarum]